MCRGELFSELERQLGKPEFGRKMTCTACAVRFFDLSRVPAVCPKCGAEQPRVKPRAAPLARGSAVRWASGRQPAAYTAIAPEAVVAEPDPVEEVEDVEEDDVEDAELLEDDDDEPKVIVAD